MKKYAVVWCSEVAPPQYRDRLVEEFRRGGEHWDVLSPADPGFDALAKGYDGYIVSGSEKSVVDDAATPFVANVLNLLRTISTTSESPVLGICFGAQALAAALGGKVGRNPSQDFRLGVETLQWADGVDTDRWPEAGEQSALVVSHGECVEQLPPRSTLLASSQTIPHEIFLVGDRFLGVQGHPEMDKDMLSESFMQWHRPLFDDDRWAVVEHEMTLPLYSTAVRAMGRRLLDEGRL